MLGGELAQGRAERAARLLGASLELREYFLFSPEEHIPYEALQNALREALGEVVQEALLVDGRAMTLEQATAYALENG